PKGKDLIGEELKPKHALLTSIWRFSPEKENPHPAPFPLALPIRAIYSIMDERKGVVIDPYCGSGTTLVAAKLLGHDYIGIDISKEYVEFAEKRIENCESEIVFMQEEMARHTVTKTFKERKENGEFTGKYRTQNGKEEITNTQTELSLFSFKE
ncbi:TPA: site-specific DNA-methyltransferase, partial [Candidatus Poribacteria bacterium]|nr:site-specific DNA-methyltransferase [Candidatus Poribacteria bacterium]